MLNIHSATTGSSAPATAEHAPDVQIKLSIYRITYLLCKLIAIRLWSEIFHAGQPCIGVSEVLVIEPSVMKRSMKQNCSIGTFDSVLLV